MPRKQETKRPAKGENESRERPALEHRYGSIGIPAVAAAARYSVPEKAAEPPLSAAWQSRYEEASA